jgi:hypothetical protein
MDSVILIIMISDHLANIVTFKLLKQTPLPKGDVLVVQQMRILNEETPNTLRTRNIQPSYIHRVMHILLASKEVLM